MFIEMHLVVVLSAGLAFVTVDSSPQAVPALPFAPGHPSGHLVPCLPEEIRCVSDGKLMFHNGTCYTPLTQGPCSKDMWLRQDSSLVSPRQGACFLRPCPEGLFPVGSTNCATLHDASVALNCTGGTAHMDARGEVHCGLERSWKEELAAEANCSDHGPTPTSFPSSTSTTKKPCKKTAKDGTCLNSAVKPTLMSSYGLTAMFVTLLYRIAL